MRLQFSSDQRRPNNMVGDAHRNDGKRFVLHADEKLMAFLGSRISDSRELSLSFAIIETISRVILRFYRGDELSINAIPQTLVICIIAYFYAPDGIDSLVS